MDEKKSREADILYLDEDQMIEAQDKELELLKQQLAELQSKN